MPSSDGQPGIRYRVRCAVDINTRGSATIERIRDLGEAAVQAEVMGEGEGGFALPPVRTARAFELEAAVVRDVDFLVRAVDEEHVCSQRKPAQIMRGAELKEIRSRDPRGIGMLNHPACVLTGNSTSVARMQRDRKACPWRVCGIGLGLPAPSGLAAAVSG